MTVYHEQTVQIGICHVLPKGQALSKTTLLFNWVFVEAIIYSKFSYIMYSCLYKSLLKLLSYYTKYKFDFLGGFIQKRCLYPAMCCRAQTTFTTQIPMLKSVKTQLIKNSIYQEKKSCIRIQQYDKSYSIRIRTRTENHISVQLKVMKHTSTLHDQYD